MVTRPRASFHWSPVRIDQFGSCGHMVVHCEVQPGQLRGSWLIPASFEESPDSVEQGAG